MRIVRTTIRCVCIGFVAVTIALLIRRVQKLAHSVDMSILSANVSMVLARRLAKV